ncbi:MAG: Gfo/Idh/MocA family oxidoreductase, partial [Lachnospiraceae bacterium]|nr:Gfo/Idh/MocA family oxidoreductase [Lachnospiraceae bacterium]
MNVGILGAGGIARKMALTLNGMEGANAYAVASRDLQKAQTFAKEEHVEKAYGSYEEMLADEKVDLVYVATPHSHHLEHA